ncbi:MAG: helix-turn-helix transcriptional regulator [Armatimonadetes bacterium]|nr:helix-turn-helix transcriptional regulator [Armatimonadota bacterium]
MDIRQLRQQQGLSLRELARRIGISATHLSRIERGQGGMSAAIADRLAHELGASLAAQPTVLRLKASYELARLFGYRPPAQPTGTLRVAFREALFREPGPALLQALDRQMRPPSFWRAAKLLPRDCNGPEQTFLLHLLKPDADIQEIHPHRLGVSCPVVQPPDRRWLAVVIKAPLLAVLPQVRIETRAGGHPQLDFLCAVQGQPTRYYDVELDGPFHDARRDRQRDEEIRKVGILPLRFSTEAAYRHDFGCHLLSGLHPAQSA